MKIKKNNVLILTCIVLFVVYFLYTRKGLNTLLLPPLPEITDAEPPEHTLCVLVPFRNVFEELLEFIPHMNAFLNRQKIRFHFVVVNQVTDGNRFNKGVIFNAGVKFITEDYQDCDYLALHDIDLLPLNDEISYAYRGDVAFHVKRVDYNQTGDEYDPQIYIGGILLISIEQYIRVNGFGNHFWGWGGEDKNFGYRLSNHSVVKTRPINLSTGVNDTFKWIHSPSRPRDHIRCASDARYQLREHESETGLHDVEYELVSVRFFEMDCVPFTMYNIKVPCDEKKTPWCKPTVC
ncbi:beta-1,4-galactosyltransferase 7-like isoform X1 [Planococcus citri]|uniref:beta-1,4-galactosyltransferase 7-like isoform X1 n=1 Tax=Planococcus citri TaxID=170843 RepID=UPI0031F9D78F